MRAPVTLRFKLLPTKGHCEPRSDVVAKRHCAQEVRPADTKPFPRRKGGRHYRATWMRLRRSVRIVGFVGMSQHAIRHCRLDRATYNFRGKHRRDLFATVGAGKLQRCAPGY